MFPEYRDLISVLKVQDAHFAHLFNRHNDMDQTIQSMEAGRIPASATVIEGLKKEKLRLKDELFVILRKASKPA